MDALPNPSQSHVVLLLHPDHCNQRSNLGQAQACCLQHCSSLHSRHISRRRHWLSHTHLGAGLAPAQLLLAALNLPHIQRAVAVDRCNVRSFGVVRNGASVRLHFRQQGQ